LLAEQLFIECFFDSSVSGNKFLSLLSKEYNLNDKTLSIKFLFLPGEHKTNPRIMLTVTDITLQKSMEIEKNQQNDINKILSKMAFDKKGCLEFLRDLYYEINKLSDIIEKDSFTLKTIKKIYMSVHTLKGNCSFYELSKIVSAAHILEESFSELLEKNIIPDTKMRSELIEKAKTLSAAFFENIGLLEEYISFDEILSDNDIFEINSSRINDLIKTAEKNNINTELLNKIYNLKKISVKKALARYTSNAEQIAVRLNKLILPIEIINHEMLIDASYFKPVLDIISHIIKNAVSHGIEYPEERLLKNKNKFGKITIDFSEIITNEQRSVKLIISDDGKGFMLDVLGKKLIEKKILTENEITEDKIIETIICGGTSSKEKADEFSGRGIGLAAIKNIIDQFNGTLTIKTEKDKGAEVIIIIPEILKP
ncbi:hypothetical protein KA977_13560, partial [Candidatus Dependentiae bacterium]|nr:hypothetical protein [Candidatus Dependentiae bacterium]